MGPVSIATASRRSTTSISESYSGWRPFTRRTFAALADPARRAILARLRAEDILSVSELARPFPAARCHDDGRRCLALATMEMLPRDVRGAMPQPGDRIGDDTSAFFDRLAAFHESDERLHVPAAAFNAALTTRCRKDARRSPAPPNRACGSGLRRSPAARRRPPSCRLAEDRRRADRQPAYWSRSGP